MGYSPWGHKESDTTDGQTLSLSSEKKKATQKIIYFMIPFLINIQNK